MPRVRCKSKKNKIEVKMHLIRVWGNDLNNKKMLIKSRRGEKKGIMWIRFDDDIREKIKFIIRKT